MYRREATGRALQSLTATRVSSGRLAAYALQQLSRRPSHNREFGSLRVPAIASVVVVAASLWGSVSPVYAAAPEPPETAAATEVAATTARLNGVLDPNAAGAPGTFLFRYGPSPTACEEGQKETPQANDAGLQKEVATATVENLLPATNYTFCLVAANSEGAEQVPGSIKAFRTPAGPPTVGKGTVLITGATTALVSAAIGPGGLPASYYAEFVPQSAFQANGWSEARRVPIPAAELPAASAPVVVSEELPDLQPTSVYRFRFVVTTALGTVAGADEALTTAVAGVSGNGLPDERAFELVSSPGTGEPYLPPTPISTGEEATGFRARLLFRAAADGEKAAYVAEPGVSVGTGQTGPGEGNQWLATRGSSSWKAEDITPSENANAMYESFSSDLSTGIYEGDTVPLTPEVEAGCASLYTRTSSSASFEALFASGETLKDCGHPLFAGASANESQIIFQSEAALTPGSEEATEADVPPGHSGQHHASTSIGEGCMFGCNLYAWSGGHLALVNEVGGKAVPGATFGGFAPGQDEFTNFSNAISADGSRIFWTDTLTEKIYVRENGNTVAVSGSGPAEYWAASADGRYAFYTEAGELWRFDTQTNASELLTTAGAGVQGVIGTNQTGNDGAYVYFVANAVLSSVPNSRGHHAEPGECPASGSSCNLYVLHEGVTAFIGKLSSADNELHSASEGFHTTSSVWKANVGERLAQITPDGRHLAFQSLEELTGYDSGFENTEGRVGEPQPAVFVYSAEGGALDCASCSPADAAPSVNEGGVPQTKLPVSSEANTYMRRWISEDGSRVFFDSSQPLVSKDTNRVQDVYEWERPSTSGAANNSCATDEASPVTGGCTYMLSGGTSKVDSFLIDADAAGNNVFFEHIGSLGQLVVPTDHNELYDARVHGGFAQASTGCTGAACQPGALSPPVLPPPASLTFSGIGNFPAAAKPVVKPLTRQQKLARALKSCKGHKKLNTRRSCEKQARKKYGAAKPKQSRSKAKRASHDRRAHS